MGEKGADLVKKYLCCTCDFVTIAPVNTQLEGLSSFTTLIHGNAS
jgi:hypothetical protein